MRVGTKSRLFGVHDFVIHTALIAVACGELPTVKSENASLLISGDKQIKKLVELGDGPYSSAPFWCIMVS
jgi:hypothetical protein